MNAVDGLRRSAAGLFVALLVSAGGATAEASAACSNDGVRLPVDRALPDCRAYEQVSPVAKNGNDVGIKRDADGHNVSTIVAAADGSGVAYETMGVFGGAVGSATLNANLSSRGPEGWGTQVLVPPQAPRPTVDFPSFLYFTPDLSTSVVRTPAGASLAAGDISGATNLYLRDTATGAYTTLSTNPPVLQSGSSISYGFAGISDDLSHVLFVSNDALTPDAPVPADPSSGVWDNVYEWVDGHIRLVSILPNGSPAASGAFAGSSYGEPSFTVMSADGSRIVFGTPVDAPDGGQIYVRENGQQTVEASASQRATPDPSAPSPPQFWAASSDGSKVFFSSSLALTDDATIGVNSLYRYDVNSGTLTNLTIDPDPSVPPGEGVVGVLGTSRDGSYVYFQSTRQYVNGQGTAGLWNLYVWHNGSISFVAADNVGDANVSFGANLKTARVTPDGRHLVFTALRSLTGYDNVDAVTGQPHSQVYLYDASSGALTCASCNPSGRSPVGDSTLPKAPPRAPADLQRSVSDDGSRVFFDSQDDLVPADVNGKVDPYVYEDGAVHLLSTGASSDDSYFGGASTTGDDVFIVTREQLLPTDTDDNLDVYDVRVGGGFAYAPPSQACTGDGCQGAPTPRAALPGPASSSGSADANAGVSKPRPGSFSVAKLSKSSRREAARSGYLRLSVRVSTGGIVKARASRTVGRHAVTVAKVDANVPRAATTHLRLRLAKSVRTALARGRKVKLSVRVSFSHARSAKTMTLELQR